MRSVHKHTVHKTKPVHIKHVIVHSYKGVGEKGLRGGGALRPPFLDPPRLQGSKVGKSEKWPVQPKKGPFNDEN